MISLCTKSLRVTAKTCETRITEAEWLATVVGRKWCFSSGEALIKVTLCWRKPLFLFSNLISAACRQFYCLLTGTDMRIPSRAARWPNPMTQSTSAISEAFARRWAMCIFGSSFLLAGARHPRMACSGVRFAPWPQTSLTFGMSDFFACGFHCNFMGKSVESATFSMS